MLGRAPDVELFVDDDRISRRHASFRFDGEWLAEDLGSKNGLTVDGSPARLATLTGDHWIDVGGVLLRFQVIDDDDALRLADETLSRWRSSHRFQRRLTPDLEPREILERLLRSALELSGLERGFVLCARNGEQNDLDIVARQNLSFEELSSERFRGSVGAVHRALAERRMVAATDASLDTWLGERASILTGGIRGLVCLPLIVDDDVLGAFYADSRRPGASVTELDAEILSALAHHAALALSLTLARRRLAALEAAAAGDQAAAAETAAPVIPGEASWRRLVELGEMAS